jgi:transposase-like protein
MNTGLDSREEGAGVGRRVRPGRRSTPEKLEAVKAILSGKASVDAVAQKFGVKAETVAQWRDQALSALEDAMGTNEQGTPRERELERENKRLQKALADLAVERTLLGQALEEWKKQSRPSRPRR